MPADDLASYQVHRVPFDEWVDIDTLIHRTALTSGDFDYTLQPACPECSLALEAEYDIVEDEQAGGQEVISSLVCHVCHHIWEPDQPAS